MYINCCAVYIIFAYVKPGNCTNCTFAINSNIGHGFVHTPTSVNTHTHVHTHDLCGVSAG